MSTIGTSARYLVGLVVDCDFCTLDGGWKGCRLFGIILGNPGGDLMSGRWSEVSVGISICGMVSVKMLVNFCNAYIGIWDWSNRS